MSKAEEEREMVTYSIFRTGATRKRTYQINKLVIGVVVDNYWVELKGRGQFYCGCLGFRRQSYPAIDHKHIKIAMDFSERGEPINALYKIEGTGGNTTIEYLGA